jgi:hypothetical protein
VLLVTTPLKQQLSVQLNVKFAQLVLTAHAHSIVETDTAQMIPQSPLALQASSAKLAAVTEILLVLRVMSAQKVRMKRFLAHLDTIVTVQAIQCRLCLTALQDLTVLEDPRLQLT